MRLKGNCNCRRLLSVLLIFLVLSILSVFLSPAHSEWDGDIDDIAQQLDRDFKFGGKEGVKAENLQQAITQLKEDFQIAISTGNLSGMYSFPVPFGPFAGNLIFFDYQVAQSGDFTATGSVPGISTFSFTLSGKITGNTSTFKITRTQIVGPPTNFTPCTESVLVTGTIVGSGEQGTTHSFTRPPLCNEPQGPSVIHTKK
ncbi:MAG: hypothetical protein G3M70_12700 [Candidatus Nitronauta litoralis]|uniref:Uncharacterized protein n=1 Tax=Candidatus Nitronauta litoralis TaxID=2705533 RepID=A0A7T0G184_9BACT|nr:MAG: hypothetical protein G3M70_12700 [Candidatus Nitronauta litoralis]